MARRGTALRLHGLVALLAVVAAVSPLDELVHDFVFRRVVTHEARLVANGFTLLGTTEAAAGVLGVLTLAAYRSADLVLWRSSVGGLAGLAAGGLAAQAVKHVACRARPRLVDGWGVGDGPRATDPGRYGFFHSPCFGRWKYHSFPSGHATTGFTVAAALTLAAPSRRRSWLVIAAGIGASRVFLNAHFLSDVLAGGLLGWWSGLVGFRLADAGLARFPRLAPGAARDGAPSPAPTGHGDRPPVSRV